MSKRRYLTRLQPESKLIMQRRDRNTRYVERLSRLRGCDVGAKIELEIIESRKFRRVLHRRPECRRKNVRQARERHPVPFENHCRARHAAFAAAFSRLKSGLLIFSDHERITR